MLVVEVDNLDCLIFLVERVNFGRGRYAARPKLIDTEVQVPTTVNPHEHNVIFLVLFTLRVLLPAVSQRVLARLSIEHIVEIIIEKHAWRVEVQEDRLLLLVK